jgi:hypothetical protein
MKQLEQKAMKTEKSSTQMTEGLQQAQRQVMEAINRIVGLTSDFREVGKRLDGLE